MTWADEPDRVREFDDVAAFVRGWLAPTYRRSLDTGGRVWCPEWEQHAEAVSRLTGVWVAYERQLGQDGAGLSAFWRDHVDPAMTALLAADGPFQRCARGHTDRLPALPTGTART